MFTFRCSESRKQISTLLATLSRSSSVPRSRSPGIRSRPTSTHPSSPSLFSPSPTSHQTPFAPSTAHFPPASHFLPRLRPAPRPPTGSHPSRLDYSIGSDPMPLATLALPLLVSKVQAGEMAVRLSAFSDHPRSARLPSSNPSLSRARRRVLGPPRRHRPMASRVSGGVSCLRGTV